MARKRNIRRSSKNRTTRATRSNAPVRGPIMDWLKRILQALFGGGSPSKLGASVPSQGLGTMPGAYANVLQPRFKMVQNETSVTVSGCDLVTPVPSDIKDTEGDYVFSVITSNPAYWSGTRVAQMAAMYLNWRPTKMYFCYIPQVSVNQEGTVVMGTLWNGSAPSNNLQQTLFTSNGGLMTQCYVPAVSEIKLGSNLPQNMFNMNGPLEQGTNPFMFMAALRGAHVVPGYFYVMYQFEFKNPVGEAWDYGVRYKTPLSNVEAFDVDNISVVPLSQYGSYGPGTVFGYDKVASLLTYNNRLVPQSVGASYQTSQRVAVYYNEQHPAKHDDGEDPVDPTPTPQRNQIHIAYDWSTPEDGGESYEAYFRQTTQFKFFTDYHDFKPPYLGYPRWYLVVSLQYLDDNGNPVSDTRSTSRANIAYRIMCGAPGSTPKSFFKVGWSSLVGYIPSMDELSETVGKTDNGCFIAGLDGKTQVWKVTSQIPDSQHVYSSYAIRIDSQANVDSMIEINAYMTQPFDGGINIPLPSSPLTTLVEEAGAVSAFFLRN